MVPLSQGSAKTDSRCPWACIALLDLFFSTFTFFMARDYQLQSPGFSAPTNGIDFAAELNAEQLAAVTSPPGPSLVIAGAGSGKTRTLTYRVAFLLERGVPAGNILLLTFTNKAAKEMLQRVEDLVPVETRELWGGTFHSIGSRILRRYADRIGFQANFSILDSEDQKDLLKSIIVDSKIDTKTLRFPKPDLLLNIYSLSKNTGVELEDLLHTRYSYLTHLAEDIIEIHEQYEDRKQSSNAMDFDDLLEKTLKLLSEDSDARETMQKKFEWILVDEYQDTNQLQVELIRLLAEPQNNIMAVGDDAQSIYSWRGADVDNILEFEMDYPGAAQFVIETNYRSVPEILTLANAAIRPNKAQFAKNLAPARSETATRYYPARQPRQPSGIRGAAHPGT